MALYPAAVQRPLAKGFTLGIRIARHERCNLHTQAGLGSLFGYFNQPKQVESHFWVSKTGVVEQYVDTDYMAQADWEGNETTVSIETEGSLEPWTPAQLAAIVKLVRWVLATHNIPRRLCTSSKIGPASQGLGWHRLGCDGNFPAAPSRYAGRLQLGGGRRYSRTFGKVCPGEARLDQILDVIAPQVFTTNTQSEEDDVALTDNEKRALAWLDENRAEFDTLQYQVRDIWGYRQRWLDTEARVAALDTTVKALSEAQGLPVEQVLEVLERRLSALKLTVSVTEEVSA